MVKTIQSGSAVSRPYVRANTSPVVIPRCTNFRDLHVNYQFPGSTTLRAWKDHAPEQYSTRYYSHILYSDHTSPEGFQRIDRIGDRRFFSSDDDRAAIGLILKGVNSDRPEIKRVGYEYMLALLSRPMTPETTRFVYDTLVNNVLNQIGWDIANKQTAQEAHAILSGADPFSPLLLHLYGMYPYLDLKVVLQENGLPHGAIKGDWNFGDMQAWLRSRLREMQPKEPGGHPVPESKQEIRLPGGLQDGVRDMPDRTFSWQAHPPEPDFEDYEGFHDFPSIFIGGISLDQEVFTRPILIRM